MLASLKIVSRPLGILLTLIIIGIITFLDYVTGSELSFSVFYLIPVSFIAFIRSSRQSLVMAISILAAICWFCVEINTRAYSTDFFPIWNGFARLIIFCTLGLLLFSFREKHDALDEKNNELNRINTEKNKFIGIAAHDLRNPISGIYSFSDLLLNDPESKMNKEEYEIVRHIKSLSENILDLIKNLLDVSKIESGQIEIVWAQQDYVKFIRNQVQLNQILAKAKHIDIQLNVQNDRIMADFDEQPMSQVIGNLLSNAIKYSEKHSNITINVTENNGMVITEVIDYSKGIPLEEQQKLFNYFQKTSSRPTDGETSTGLGLAIVKKIITAFNGSIAVNSTVGEGSNFYFSFPKQR